MTPQIIRSDMEAALHVSAEHWAYGLQSEPHVSDHALVYADFPGL